MELLTLIFTLCFGGVLVAWMWSTRQFHKQQEESMKRCYKVLEGKE